MVGGVKLVNQFFNLFIGAVFFRNAQRGFFLNLFNNVGGNVIGQIMGGNQTFLQFVGKRTDNLFNDRNRQVGTINQVFFDIVAVGIFINNRIVGLFNDIGAFIGDENADDIF